MQILMIGNGAMGNALLQRLEDNYSFTVIDPFKDHCFKSINELPNDYSPDVVIIAIKPQSLAETLPTYKKFNHALFISIAAGVICENYKQWLSPNVRLSRVMPNLAVKVAESASAFFLNENCNENDKNIVTEIFNKVGVVKQLQSENLFDAVTALSGSGPAYVYYLCECLSEVGKGLGLDVELADSFARQTIIGAASTLKELPDSPKQLRSNVTSKGGTTEAALSILMENDALKNLFSKALSAANSRCMELSKSL